MPDLIHEYKLFEGETKGEYTRNIVCAMLADSVWENHSATTIDNDKIIEAGTYITNSGVLPFEIITSETSTTKTYFYILLDTTSTADFTKIAFEKRIYHKNTGEWDVSTVQSITLHKTENVQWAFIALKMKYKQVLQGKIVYLHTNGSLVASEDLNSKIINIFNTDDVVVNYLAVSSPLEQPDGFIDENSAVFKYIVGTQDSNVMPDPPLAGIKTDNIINPIWSDDEDSINYMCDYYALDYRNEPPSVAPAITPLQQYKLLLENNLDWKVDGSSLYYKDGNNYIVGYDGITDHTLLDPLIAWNYSDGTPKVIATQKTTGKYIYAKKPSTYADSYRFEYRDKDDVVIGETINYSSGNPDILHGELDPHYYTGSVYRNVIRNVCMGFTGASNPRYHGMFETYFLRHFYTSEVRNPDNSMYASYQDVIVKDVVYIDAEATAWFILGDDMVIEESEDEDTEPDEGKEIEDEQIEDAPLPSTSALDIGVISIFNPTSQQMQDLTTEMQDQNFLDEIAKYFKNSPLEGIMSCHVVPINVETSGTDAPHFGNWQFETQMAKVSEQFYTVNFGSIKLEKKFGSFLDYSPYTHVQVYLPYIGYREIDVDDAMGKNIGVKYNVDIVTGAILAQVLIDDSVHYQFSGSAIMQFPLTASNHNNLISSIVGLVTSGATTIAGLAVGGPAGGVGAAMAVGGAMSLAQSAVHTVASSKPEIQHGGSFAMTNGFLSVKTPYLVTNRPVVDIPVDFAKYTGRMSNKTKFVSECSGYTEFASVDVNMLTALEDEKAEIEQILKGGFYA